MGSDWVYWAAFAFAAAGYVFFIVRVARDRRLDRFMDELDRKRRRDEWRNDWPDVTSVDVTVFLLERAARTVTRANDELALRAGDGS